MAASPSLRKRRAVVAETEKDAAEKAEAARVIEVDVAAVAGVPVTAPQALRAAPLAAIVVRRKALKDLVRPAHLPKSLS